MEIGEKIVLKKAHPCGGKAWVIVRLGADVKLQCQTCGRFVNLTRDELRKRATPSADEGKDRK